MKKNNLFLNYKHWYSWINYLRIINIFILQITIKKVEIELKEINYTVDLYDYKYKYK